MQQNIDRIAAKHSRGVQAQYFPEANLVFQMGIIKY